MGTYPPMPQVKAIISPVGSLSICRSSAVKVVMKDESPSASSSEVVERRGLDRVNAGFAMFEEEQGIQGIALSVPV